MRSKRQRMERKNEDTSRGVSQERKRAVNLLAEIVEGGSVPGAMAEAHCVRS